MKNKPDKNQMLLETLTAAVLLILDVLIKATSDEHLKIHRNRIHEVLRK